MHISFDFSLQRWMVGIWFWKINGYLEIFVDVGPLEWTISFGTEE